MVKKKHILHIQNNYIVLQQKLQVRTVEQVNCMWLEYGSIVMSILQSESYGSIVMSILQSETYGSIVMSILQS